MIALLSFTPYLQVYSDVANAAHRLVTALAFFEEAFLLSWKQTSIILFLIIAKVTKETESYGVILIHKLKKLWLFCDLPK